MDHVHFLNLQYWYCLFFSFVGEGCAYFRDQLNGQATSTPVESVGFFEGLAIFFSNTLGSFGGIVASILSTVWNWYSVFAFAISAFLILLILFAFFGLLFVRIRDRSLYGFIAPSNNEGNPRSSRWESLLEDAKSTDPKKWRNAIFEADALLGELLQGLGYEGENTGDKMQRLSEDAFVTVPVAWEAHRIKNFVSSGSSDFILTQREAFRTMKLYEQVFEEFDYI
ncbi:hypothetical protein COU15_02280 [Candidatus Kaiserbacteria bacterium CG10_big_fil_rev_8_21_14_0_10_45_20]|uniref:Uncharacterized protein n=1 Tax=Candidatus Kaiserbacteria bacterium CG10_big_fil_rev_8_21_14_0_10_45_20 TaxID=1974607 RepID=A0A2H0UFP5_9BACT|nr:MAG: hypothetical protein COU15_02280 [Candidatus Kaiserbacteria bacterium CG10_big_fil_rev_8_21_14_0_10_45_20]